MFGWCGGEDVWMETEFWLFLFLCFISFLIFFLCFFGMDLILNWREFIDQYIFSIFLLIPPYLLFGFATSEG